MEMTRSYSNGFFLRSSFVIFSMMTITSFWLTSTSSDMIVVKRFTPRFPKKCPNHLWVCIYAIKWWVNNVTNYSIYLCKILGLKISVCKKLDKLDQVYCAWLIKWWIISGAWWYWVSIWRYWLVLGQYKLVLLDIRWYIQGQQRACMLVYIGKSGDLIGCYRYLTHWLTDNKI